MTEKGRKYLSDILMAIDLVENFTIDTENFDTYQNDLKTQSAVERQLAIIGEALNKFKQIEPTVLVQNDKEIIALRNRLIHAYDNTDNTIIWVIIKRRLIPFKKVIAQLAN